jgi:hypothetical protein
MQEYILHPPLSAGCSSLQAPFQLFAKSGTSMTNSSDETTPEADYNEILSKLEALLRKHQGNPSASASVETDGKAEAFHIAAHGTALALEQRSLIAVDEIPTLTEMVYLAPEMLSPQPDVTSLLAQILDSALGDAEVDLNADVRKILVQALESRLFGR